jgi:hypothetical protein
LKRFLAEIGALLQAASSPAGFYPAVRQRVLAALGGVAAAVWTRTAQGDFQVEHQIQLARAGPDQVANARPCHDAMPRRVAKGERPLRVPPQGDRVPAEAMDVPANLTPHAVLLAPILIDQEAAGVPAVWLEPNQDASARKAAAPVRRQGSADAPLPPAGRAAALRPRMDGRGADA